MSLLPNRTVFQKDTVRTWNYLADGSCHLGTHLELLKATQPGQALTSKVPVTVELRITGAPSFPGMEDTDSKQEILMKGND